MLLLLLLLLLLALPLELKVSFALKSGQHFCWLTMLMGYIYSGRGRCALPNSWVAKGTGICII